MASRKNEWIARRGTWCLVGVSALSLNGCIFFGTEFCDSSIEPGCEYSGVGGNAQAGGPGDGDGDDLGTGGISSGASGGMLSEATGGRNTGGANGTGGATGGVSSGGASTGGDDGTGGTNTGGDDGTGGEGTGGDGTGGSNTGGSDGTGGDGSGGTSGVGRLTISEVRIGNGSTWVELHNGSGFSVSTANLWISSAATGAPNYSEACSLASLGTMNDGTFAIVNQVDSVCSGGVSLCVRACLTLVATANRYIQLFEGPDSGTLIMIKQAFLPTPQPGIGQTYHVVSNAEGTFYNGIPSPGELP